MFFFSFSRGGAWWGGRKGGGGVWYRSYFFSEFRSFVFVFVVLDFFFVYEDGWIDQPFFLVCGREEGRLLRLLRLLCEAPGEKASFTSIVSFAFFYYI